MGPTHYFKDMFFLKFVVGVSLFAEVSSLSLFFWVILTLAAHEAKVNCLVGLDLQTWHAQENLWDIFSGLYWYVPQVKWILLLLKKKNTLLKAILEQDNGRFHCWNEGIKDWVAAE